MYCLAAEPSLHLIAQSHRKKPTDRGVVCLPVVFLEYALCALLYIHIKIDKQCNGKAIDVVYVFAECI